MRIGIIGGGVIARLAMEHIRKGDLGDATVVAIAGRSAGSKGRPLAEEFGVPFVVGLEEMMATEPEVVMEAASHEAVREYAEPVLARGVSFVALSAGALCDDALRERLERTAAQHRALLYVPSGGIGGLDTLKAVCLAGAEEVSIAVTKPPAAWKGIPYVERLGVNLDALSGATVLFEGSAREGVPHFPANVNIAAVLSMAGIGFDRTRLKVVADPALQFNTHFIVITGRTGRVDIKFESVAMPENPKTSMLACFSALAAIRELGGSTRYGT
ncbi:MAG: aspartate dehydrogenase [Betaproteobacteria bacterium]|nr:aspartate dehydrogenase [Betaproteobacteria bacterium]